MAIRPLSHYIDQPSAQLIPSLVSVLSQTTADGAATGLTLVDANLIGQPSMEGECLIIIDGGAAGQSRSIVTHTLGTGTLTVDRAFTDGAGAVQTILAGTRYVIMPFPISLATLAAIAADTDPKVMGRLQIKATTIDLNQGVGTYVLFTATTQDVVVEKLVIRMSGGAIGGALTSISIQTDDATPIVLIDALAGAVANLTNEAQLAWTGAILLDAGTAATIGLTIAGGAAGVARVCDVVAECRAVVAGGYLT